MITQLVNNQGNINLVICPENEDEDCALQLFHLVNKNEEIEDSYFNVIITDLEG